MPALGRHQRLRLFHRIRRHAPEIEHLLVKGDDAPGDARHLEQVVDQVGHVLDLPDDDVGGVAHAIGIEAVQLEQFGGGADRRLRVAQLMREHGQEIDRCRLAAFSSSCMFCSSVTSVLVPNHYTMFPMPSQSG